MYLKAIREGNLLIVEREIKNTFIQRCIKHKKNIELDLCQDLNK